MMRPTVLVAPNAFKNGPDAFQCAEAMRAGLHKSKLNPECILKPIADGGDGTLPILLQALGGESITQEVLDPIGRVINSGFGYVSASGTAIIELADASGLRLLETIERDPLQASTFGTGQLIVAAMKKGATTVLLSVGGSATVDGGMGILGALGYKFKSAEGAELKPNGNSLALIETVEPAPFPKHVEVIVLSDVKNLLTGDNGAARIYGPQKGASDSQVGYLDKGLENWARLIKDYTGRDVSGLPGGGAAGGVAAGLYGWLGASIKPGAAHILGMLDMEEAVRCADVVLTAEGSIDAQTAEGKAPFALLELAKKWGKPVIGLAGSIPLESTTSLDSFDALLAIGNQPEPLESAISHTLANLERTAYNIGNLLFLQLNSKAS